MIKMSGIFKSKFDPGYCLFIRCPYNCGFSVGNTFTSRTIVFDFFRQNKLEVLSNKYQYLGISHCL
jgi:hypothetical protein